MNCVHTQFEAIMTYRLVSFGNLLPFYTAYYLRRIESAVTGSCLPGYKVYHLRTLESLSTGNISPCHRGASFCNLWINVHLFVQYNFFLIWNLNPCYKLSLKWLFLQIHFMEHNLTKIHNFVSSIFLDGDRLTKLETKIMFPDEQWTCAWCKCQLTAESTVPV